MRVNPEVACLVRGAVTNFVFRISRSRNEEIADKVEAIEPVNLKLPLSSEGLAIFSGSGEQIYQLFHQSNTVSLYITVVHGPNIHSDSNQLSAPSSVPLGRLCQEALSHCIIV